jgi:Protein of unknwon function (DUF3310)
MNTTPTIGPWHCPHCNTSPIEPHKPNCIFSPGFEKIEIPRLSDTPNDPVNHPSHYTEHPSGVECIQITEHMNFCLGNAVKYIWRAGLKNDNAIEDLKKARWYVDRELERLTK